MMDAGTTEEPDDVRATSVSASPWERALQALLDDAGGLMGFPGFVGMAPREVGAIVEGARPPEGAIRHAFGEIADASRWNHAPFDVAGAKGPQPVHFDPLPPPATTLPTVAYCEEAVAGKGGPAVHAEAHPVAVAHTVETLARLVMGPALAQGHHDFLF